MKLVLTEPVTELKTVLDNDLWVSPTEAETKRGEAPFVGREYPGQSRIKCYFGQKEINIKCQVRMDGVNTCCLWDKEKEGRLIVIGWLDSVVDLHKDDTLNVRCRWDEAKLDFLIFRP